MKALVIAAGGGIGDVLLATPVMRALRTRYETVVALTAPGHREVLAANPDLADVWVDEGPFPALAARIARARFDAAVVTPDSGAAHLAGMAGVPCVDLFEPSPHVAYDVLRWRPWAAPCRTLVLGPDPAAGAAAVMQALCELRA